MSPKLEISQTSISVKGSQVRLFLRIAFHGNSLLVLYCYKTSNYEPALIFNGGIALGFEIPAI
jgi:hypothetical protein